MQKIRKLLLGLLILILTAAFSVLTINAYVKNSSAEAIITLDKALTLPQADCAIVLGAGIWDDEPSPILRDRLDQAIKLYQQGSIKKLIMSGDHGRKDYDEVKVMKSYAVKAGIPAEDVFLDHAGFSTYDSIYRAKAIFSARDIYIVTQKWHLYRALYIAQKLDLKVHGIAAEIAYRGDEMRELREVLARNKDFIKCLFLPQPKYLGEKVPLDCDAKITDD